MQPMTITPEWDAPERTPGEWQRIAADHIAEIDDMGLTPAQDLELAYGLFLGLSLDELAARMVLAPHVVKARFRALRDGLLDRRGVFPLMAQEALVVALKRRLQ